VTRRLAAAVLLLVAVGLHLGVTLPARRQRDEARDEFARGREERERLRAQTARLDQRPPAVRAPAGDAAAARALRLSLLRATDGLALRGVQIAAAPGRRGAAAARGRLVAEGSQTDLLRAAGRLAEASSGIQLERMALAEVRGTGIQLQIEAYSMRAPADAPEGAREAKP
jgi:hypothetical protein